MTSDSRTRLACSALFLLSLLLAAWAYAPGLSGIFFVDDYENLQGLQQIDADPSLRAAARYVTSGFSGPGGRPLSLATFALQHASWPEAPGDFIYVNIAIHLANACLLFGALLALLRLAPPRVARPEVIALSATWFWLFASPHAGAVLYVVQRMALLSGTCMLGGLWLYLAGRRRELEGHTATGIVHMLGGLGLGTVVGVTAKENAALFPLLVLALEATVLAQLPRSRAWRALSVVGLWLPTALVFAYLAWRLPDFFAQEAGRGFTLGQRLLTECRILFLYLRNFLLPPLYGMRLYYDDYALSRSLVTPWITLPAVLAWLAALAAALRFRRVAPVASFAVLWFLGAHLLESSVIPLELAFDHRNYVALAGPSLALAVFLARLVQVPAARRVRPLLLAGIAGYAAFACFATWQVAGLWGNPWELAHYWAERQPDSRRAQRGAAKFYWKIELPAEAVRVYEEGLKRWPGEVSFLLGIYEIGCAYPKVEMPPYARIAQEAARYDSTVPTTVGMLNVLIGGTELGLCKRYSPAELWEMVEMAFDTPKLAGVDYHRTLLLSRVAELANDRAQARLMLDRSLRDKPFAAGLNQAAEWSVQAADAPCARHYLQLLETAREVSPAERLSYEDEAKTLRDALARFPAQSAQPPGAPECPA